MLDVIANIADKTLNSRPPTPMAMTMIMAGSIKFVITRNGRPVARLTPVAKHRVLTAQQQAAWERLQAAMEEGWDIGAGPLDRDALHER